MDHAQHRGMELDMSLLLVIGLAAGALLGAALVVLVAAARGWQPKRGPMRRAQDLWASANGRRGGYAVAAGLAVAVVSRWPVAAVAAALAVWMWPALFGGARDGARQIERLEALATWTESLRDTIQGAVSLEQAIPRSVTSAAAVIAGPLQRLVGLVQSRVPLPQALARFGEEFADPTADLVVASLILNARLHGPGLAETLTQLAATTREELEMRRRIEESRKALRRGIRVIIGVIAVLVSAITVFSRQFVAPYGTAAGQVVLIFIIAIFTVGLMWIRKAATLPMPERFLADEDRLSTVGLVGVR